jgi:hypothetical protein
VHSVKVHGFLPLKAKRMARIDTYHPSERISPPRKGGIGIRTLLAATIFAGGAGAAAVKGPEISSFLRARVLGESTVATPVGTTVDVRSQGAEIMPAAALPPEATQEEVIFAPGSIDPVALGIVRAEFTANGAVMPASIVMNGPSGEGMVCRGMAMNNRPEAPVVLATGGCITPDQHRALDLMIERRRYQE